MKEKNLKFILFTIILFGFFGLAVRSFAANYPLEIIQPRAGLDTKNRYYKAYPGIEYNVRAAVIGGVFPYVYELSTAPSGMTINQDTGLISWPNPTTSGSPYTVTLKVTDSESTNLTITWTITVTTSGFIFLDAVNGTHAAGLGCSSNCGTGTISNPFKSIIDWYGGNDYASKGNNAYANNFIYYRAGTYTIDGYTGESNDDGTYRMPCSSYVKPVVWLAYPGDAKPVIDNGATKSIIFYAGTNNVYFDGLKITNSGGYGIQTESDGNSQTFRRMTFDRLGPTSGSNNQSFIRVLANGPGYYMAIQDSTFNDLNHGAGIKLYETHKMVVENNILSNIRDTTGADSIEGVAVKGNTSKVYVRQNIIHDVPARGIGGNNDITTDSEYLYNYIYNALENAIEVNQDSVAQRIYIYRNTFVGRVQVLNATSSSGPFYFDNNVIINNDSGTHIYCGGGVNGCSSPLKVVANNNLIGTPSDNIVDSNGNLTVGYAQYVGTRGWQLGGGSSDTTPPAAPSGLSVQ